MERSNEWAIAILYGLLNHLINWENGWSLAFVTQEPLKHQTFNWSFLFGWKQPANHSKLVLFLSTEIEPGPVFVQTFGLRTKQILINLGD